MKKTIIVITSILGCVAIVAGAILELSCEHKHRDWLLFTGLKDKGKK